MARYKRISTAQPVLLSVADVAIQLGVCHIEPVAPFSGEYLSLISPEDRQKVEFSMCGMREYTPAHDSPLVKRFPILRLAADLY